RTFANQHRRAGAVGNIRDARPRAFIDHAIALLPGRWNIRVTDEGHRSGDGQIIRQSLPAESLVAVIEAHRSGTGGTDIDWQMLFVAGVITGHVQVLLLVVSPI